MAPKMVAMRDILKSVRLKVEDVLNVKTSAPLFIMLQADCIIP